MERYIDLDKWTPEKLTMKVNGVAYPVRDITVEMFLELLELCQMGTGNDAQLNKFVDEVRKQVHQSLWTRATKKLQQLFQLLRRGRPVSEETGKRKLARFIKKAVPDLPIAILRGMSQKQIQGFLEFLIQSYYEGQTNPNFLKPMSDI